MILGPLKLALKLVSLLVAAGVVYLAVTLVQVVQEAHRDQAAPAQAIIVLGAAQYNGRPSPDLAARLDHAVALWRRGLAPVIVVTGGRRPGDAYTEAQAGSAYLQQRGVPAAAIIAEDTGSDSWRSLAAAAATLTATGRRRVILVSDPFHDARVAAMSSELGLEPLVSPTRTSPITGTSTYPYFAKETAEVAIGRIIGFARLAGATRALSRVHAPAPGG